MAGGDLADRSDELANGGAAASEVGKRAFFVDRGSSSAGVEFGSKRIDSLSLLDELRDAFLKLLVQFLEGGVRLDGVDRDRATSAIPASEVSSSAAKRPFDLRFQEQEAEDLLSTEIGCASSTPSFRSWEAMTSPVNVWASLACNKPLLRAASTMIG